MKILKNGNVDLKKFIGKTFDCSRCGCNFEIEAEDLKKIKEVSEERGTGMVGYFKVIPCPECGDKVVLGLN